MISLRRPTLAFGAKGPSPRRQSTATLAGPKAPLNSPQFSSGASYSPHLSPLRWFSPSSSSSPRGARRRAPSTRGLPTYDSLLLALSWRAIYRALIHIPSSNPAGDMLNTASTWAST